MSPVGRRRTDSHSDRAGAGTAHLCGYASFRTFDERERAPAANKRPATPHAVLLPLRDRADRDRQSDVTPRTVSEHLGYLRDFS